MDAALFDQFGEMVTIAGVSVQVIAGSGLESFGAMAGNVTSLSIYRATGIRPRKGDTVVYQGRDRVIAGVPDHHDELISFELS
jgi:hypothetical protein